MEINEILKTLRQQKHLTQQELSVMLGINLSSYQKYERPNNTIKPSIESLIKIADFYGVTVDYLLGREPQKESTINYEEVKKKTATIIERIESLPPEYQDVMCKIVQMLADVENTSNPIQKTESPLVYCGTVGEELERRKREEEAIRKDTA